MSRLSCCAWLLALSALAVAAKNPSLQEQYDSLWGKNEVKAVDPTSRAKLAGDLYAAAKISSSKSMKLLLCEKAYHWGRMDFPGGHQHAAQALEMMTRLDPKSRLNCLEKLDSLYYGAWKANTSKYSKGTVKIGKQIETKITEADLIVGIDLANVKVQIAQQRMIDLFSRHSTQGLPKNELLSGLNECKRDYLRAISAAQKVLSTAKSYSHIHVWPETREMLRGFVDKHNPIVEKIREQQTEVTQLYDRYKREGEASLPPRKRAGAAKKYREAARAHHAAVARLQALRTAIENAQNKDDKAKAAKAKADAEAQVKAAEAKIAAAGFDVPQLISDEGGEEIDLNLAWNEKRCTTCRQVFVPPLENKSEQRCYWCSKKSKGFFGLSSN